jgi:hypothetical protein
MFERLKSILTTPIQLGRGGVSFSALSTLASPPLPTKVASKQQTLPSYLTTATPNPESPLLRKDRLLANKDILDYRTSSDSRQIIKDFTRTDPNLSAAVTAYIRTGITAGYTAIARNLDGTVNPEATSALAQVITRMDVLNDYTIGFDDGRSIRSLSESWAREIFTMGAMCGELVLDKLRLPSHVHPIASAQVRLYPSKDGKKLVPRQFLAGQYIDLDIPTFFMVTLDEDLTDPYPISPIEPAIQAVLAGAEFLNDLRKIVKKAIHPRVRVTLDEEKFRKNLPLEIQNDSAKINAYMTTVVGDLETKINGMNPEDALILFDTIGVEVIDHGNTNLSNEYEVIQKLFDAKLASGAKVLPTVLGHSDGTSNTASAEVLLFIKFVGGTVTAKLNEMFSKMFTLSTRLMGYDVYVEFKYNDIELKPKSELESFGAMKQSRVLQLLSLGLMTDEEASIELTGHLPPAGMTPLMGTGFFEAKAAAPAGDGNNGASNGGSTMNHATRTTTPTAPKGGAGKPKADLELVG